MKPLLLLTTLFLLIAQAEPPPAYQGTWSAPSLSQRSTPIIITLRADGQATEQVGTYHGLGTWKTTDAGAEILWASQWISLLRPTNDGKYELLTWKPNRTPSDPPDDTQPAQRIK